MHVTRADHLNYNELGQNWLLPETLHLLSQIFNTLLWTESTGKLRLLHTSFNSSCLFHYWDLYLTSLPEDLALPSLSSIHAAILLMAYLALQTNKATLQLLSYLSSLVSAIFTEFTSMVHVCYKTWYLSCPLIYFRSEISHAHVTLTTSCIICHSKHSFLDFINTSSPFSLPCSLDTPSVMLITLWPIPSVPPASLSFCHSPSANPNSGSVQPYAFFVP